MEEKMAFMKVDLNSELQTTSYNTTYALRDYALALWDIAFGNIVYAGNVRRNCSSPPKSKSQRGG